MEVFTEVKLRGVFDDESIVQMLHHADMFYFKQSRTSVANFKACGHHSGL